MYRLYGKPFTMSILPQAVLDEIGAPYDLVTLTQEGVVTDPEYLKLRPDGLVPTLVDGDFVIYEGSAIAMYLADKHAEARLAPPVGSRERARYYQWMIYLGSMVHPAVALEYHPDWFAESAGAIAEVQACARRRCDELWAQIETQVGDGPWLLGEQFTAADVLFWLQAMFHHDAQGMLAENKKVNALVERAAARPTIAAIMQQHGLI
jgi:glutathione S-transferase